MTLDACQNMPSSLIYGCFPISAGMQQLRAGADHYLITPLGCSSQRSEGSTHLFGLATDTDLLMLADSSLSCTLTPTPPTPGPTEVINRPGRWPRPSRDLWLMETDERADLGLRMGD